MTGTSTTKSAASPSYRAPSLVVYGSAWKLTAAGTQGNAEGNSTSANKLKP